MQTEATAVPQAGALQTRSADNVAGNSDARDYAIGYKKPPAHHRFKKGYSGNPKGRPRKHLPRTNEPSVRDVEALMLKEAYREVASGRARK